MRSQLRNWLAGLGLVALAILLPAIYLNTRVTVTLHADGETRQVRTHASKVGGAVRDAGIVLSAEDLLVPPPEAALAPGQEIWVKRAFAVRVEADGQLRVTRTQLTSPVAILDAAGVALAERISGDTTVGHALAYCQALEAAAATALSGSSPMAVSSESTNPR